MGGNWSRRGTRANRLGDAGGGAPASTALVQPPASRDLYKRMTTRLRTFSGRLGVVAESAERLLNDGVGENEQRALAAVLRAVGLADKMCGEEDRRLSLAELAAQLRLDREERAAMESGVQRANQARELPTYGSGDPH